MEINTLTCPFVEWDPAKNESNLKKHNITFEAAFSALQKPHLEIRSDRHGEVRTLAICGDSNRIISVVYQMRENSCRIISARAARKNEKREYSKIFGRSDH